MATTAWGLGFRVGDLGREKHGNCQTSGVTDRLLQRSMSSFPLTTSKFGCRVQLIVEEFKACER